MGEVRDSTSTAVERALDILEAIGRRGGGMTNSEISRRLHIPKSSASYILRTLERRGYLRRDRFTGKYKLGLKVLNLSHRALMGLDIRDVAHPVLQQLAERTRLTANLAILDHGEVVYIEKAEAPSFIKMDTWVGRRLPVHATSVGKALVAFLPPDEVKDILKEWGLSRLTPKTITVRSRFLRELERVRAQGYAVDDEESSPGVRCVGAPIFDSFGKVEAAVSVSGTTSQIDSAHLPRIAALVMEAARKISRQLGYRAPHGH